MSPLLAPRARVPPLLPGPHTPELQPAGRPWPLTDEAVANRPFETVGDLADDPETIRPTTRFIWRPADRIIRNPYYTNSG